MSDATLDLVARLRRAVPYGLADATLLRDAASTIEQLEAERVDLAAELDGCNAAHDRSDDLIADLRQQLDRARSNLNGERVLTDRLAMLLINSQACDAPVWWVMERIDLLDEWRQRRP